MLTPVCNPHAINHDCGCTWSGSRSPNSCPAINTAGKICTQQLPKLGLKGWKQQRPLCCSTSITCKHVLMPPSVIEVRDMVHEASLLDTSRLCYVQGLSLCTFTLAPRATNETKISADNLWFKAFRHRKITDEVG
uniref:Uncharacterized protein n=1 Tax=Mesocestoides corti TaxID=53468 RepID=A0A5K3F4A3_MESCO